MKVVKRIFCISAGMGMVKLASILQGIANTTLDQAGYNSIFEVIRRHGDHIKVPRVAVIYFVDHWEVFCNDTAHAELLEGIVATALETDESLNEFDKKD